MEMKKAYICNLINGIVILFSVIWMFSGILIGSKNAALTSAHWAMFKYYTVDSNVIMGIVAFILAVVEYKAYKEKKDSINPLFLVLKLIGVVGVTLTMMVTVCFLAPTFENGWYTCFNNSNFFLHLLNPLLSIVTFCFFERTESIKFKHTITGISSMVIYAIYYVANCAIHSSNNIIEPGYDWYGFFFMGLNSMYIVLPIIFAVTYLFSFILWKVNRVKR